MTLTLVELLDIGRFICEVIIAIAFVLTYIRVKSLERHTNSIFDREIERTRVSGEAMGRDMTNK